MENTNTLEQSISRLMKRHKVRSKKELKEFLVNRNTRLTNELTTVKVELVQQRIREEISKNRGIISLL